MQEKASKTNVLTLSQPAPVAPAPVPDDDLYAVAMLKVAMELKRGQARGFEEIFEDTLKALDIDREHFKRYLSRHMDQLIRTAQKRGY
ncbi:MAG: hypothetical protein ABIJ09_24060 [Pseudomonadota bacterium]